MITINAERAIRVLVRTGDIPIGGKLPSQVRLARDLDVSTTTISAVLKKLANEGLIIPIQAGYRTRKPGDGFHGYRR